MSRANEANTGSTTQQLKSSASQIGNDLRELGGKARDAAAESFENLRGQAGEYYEQGRERAREMEQSLEQYVQEKPIQSLLIAAGIGMLLGILWKRH